MATPATSSAAPSLLGKPRNYVHNPRYKGYPADVREWERVCEPVAQQLPRLVLGAPWWRETSPAALRSDDAFIGWAHYPVLVQMIEVLRAEHAALVDALERAE
jgi:hypothetical protein